MGFLKNILSTIESISKTRQENKTARTELRQYGRTDRKQIKWDGKTEKSQIKWDGKNENSYNRNAAKALAYSNGIDPNASTWMGLSSIAQSVASGFVGSKGFDSPFTSNMAGGMDKNTMMLLGAGLLAILLIKK